MFNSGYKKAALEAAQEAGEQYQDTYDTTIRNTTGLHEKKLEAVVILKRVDDYIHSLSNKPGELSKQMSRVILKRQAFEQEVDPLQIESKKTDKISTSVARAGAMAGAGIAAFGPTAAMAVAATFGTASTGTAIATIQSFLWKKRKC